MQGFGDKTTITATIARCIIEHLRTDTMQSPQVGVFRAFTSPQFDLDQSTQAKQSWVFSQLTF